MQGNTDKETTAIRQGRNGYVGRGREISEENGPIHIATYKPNASELRGEVAIPFHGGLLETIQSLQGMEDQVGISQRETRDLLAKNLMLQWSMEKGSSNLKGKQFEIIPSSISKQNTQARKLGNRSISCAIILWPLAKALSHQASLLLTTNDGAVRMELIRVDPMNTNRFPARGQGALLKH